MEKTVVMEKTDAGSTYYVSTLPTLVRNWRASSASLKLFHLDSFKIKLTISLNLSLIERRSCRPSKDTMVLAHGYDPAYTGL